MLTPFAILLTLWRRDEPGLTWELVSVTRSNARVAAAGVGSSLEARVACERDKIIISLVNLAE